MYLHRTVPTFVTTCDPAVTLVLQALVEQPPVHPNDVLREIVELAQLPTPEAPYADDDAQLGNHTALEEDPDLIDTELNVSPEADIYGEQNFQGNVQPDMSGNAGGAWSDDNFTDAALEDETFDTSGFDVVDS